MQYQADNKDNDRKGNGLPNRYDTARVSSLAERPTEGEGPLSGRGAVEQYTPPNAQLSQFLDTESSIIDSIPWIPPEAPSILVRPTESADMQYSQKFPKIPRK
ncbi:hypothetical protein LCGC14_0358080 [marine sediment metagenome]|uniref:Uncharacterized protein n=1 Tax=marine sediment metagenome TaxID=412755 RepID=A0A0F9TRU8_9ZZZZ